MTFKTSLVDIDKINSPIPRSTFSELDLERLAHLILELDGIVYPLVVKEIGLESYELIEGFFQYFGAVKAFEINDDFEMIRAFIIKDNEADLVQQQLDLLKPLSEKKESQHVIISSANSAVETRLNNLESRLSQVTINWEQKLTEEINKISTNINQISNNLPKKIEPLTAFNELSLDKLIFVLSKVNIQGIEKKVEAIDKERKKEKFSSLNDIIERVKISKGKRKVRIINEKIMIKIIYTFSTIYFDI